MKLYPLILVALFAASILPGTCSEKDLEKKKQEEEKSRKEFAARLKKADQKEEEDWKKFYAELNKFFESVPTARKADKVLDDTIALILSVQDEASAHEAAVKINKLNEVVLPWKKPIEEEMAAYVKGKDVKNDIGLKIYVNVVQTKVSWFGEAIENIMSQGLITKELENVLQLKKNIPVTPCPAMSQERTDYWKRRFANMNRCNRVLFSLREKSDMPRVIAELKEIKKEKEALDKIDKNGGSLKESDKEGNTVMYKRFDNGPGRMANVILAVMSSRRFIETNDPEVQEVKQLIYDLG